MLDMILSMLLSVPHTSGDVGNEFIKPSQVKSSS